MKFTTTKQANKFVNVLVYGRSGIGKTRLCATAPDPLIISSESGLLSIADEDIPVIEIKDLEDLQDAYEYCKSKKAKKFKTICLDSITDLAETILSDIKENSRDGRQAYGELNEEVAKMIRKFRDLPKNTYFIAKVETYENDIGVTCYRPAMPGRTLTRDLPYFFDEVFALRAVGEDDDEKILLQTKASATWDAKDRSGKLKQGEKPNLTKIFNKIKGDKKK
jgi:phage nucleotide-binding protein